MILKSHNQYNHPFVSRLIYLLIEKSTNKLKGYSITGDHD